MDDILILFYQTKIDYPDVIISKSGVEVNPTKIKEISEWPEFKDK